MLDDAAGHAQVRPLLPGTAGCLVLVTSRRRLIALDGAQPLALDTLPPDQAVELFLRLARRTPDGAERRHRRRAGPAVRVSAAGHRPARRPPGPPPQLEHHHLHPRSPRPRTGLPNSPPETTPKTERSLPRSGCLTGTPATGSAVPPPDMHPGSGIDAYATAALAGVPSARPARAWRPYTPSTHRRTRSRPLPPARPHPRICPHPDHPPRPRRRPRPGHRTAPGLLPAHRPDSRPPPHPPHPPSPPPVTTAPAAAPTPDQPAPWPGCTPNAPTCWPASARPPPRPSPSASSP